MRTTGSSRQTKWVLACRAQGQRLTFAGMNAHHQNGLVEWHIRSLQEIARAMLIHATKHWPQATTANLWPYALHMENLVFNDTPNMQDPEKRTPQQVISVTTTNINPKDWKPIGCPVYVLNNVLQKGQSQHKRKQRSRVGIYLGPSPQHARNVALVLDRDIGLVSPQFHVQFNPSFHTVQHDKFDSLWQIKAGFVSQRELPKVKPPDMATQGKLKRKSIDKSPPTGTRPNKRTTRPGSLENTLNTNQLTNFVLSLPDLPDDKTPVIPEPPREATNDQIRSKSGGKSKPVNWLIEAMLAETSTLTAHDIEGKIFCL